jgi:hypothetical protein
MSCECAHVFLGCICSCNIVPAVCRMLSGFSALSKMQSMLQGGRSADKAYSCCCYQHHCVFGWLAGNQSRSWIISARLFPPAPLPDAPHG